MVSVCGDVTSLPVCVRHETGGCVRTGAFVRSRRLHSGPSAKLPCRGALSLTATPMDQQQLICSRVAKSEFVAYHSLCTLMSASAAPLFVALPTADQDRTPRRRRRLDQGRRGGIAAVVAEHRSGAEDRGGRRVAAFVAERVAAVVAAAADARASSRARDFQGGEEPKSGARTAGPQATTPHGGDHDHRSQFPN